MPVNPDDEALLERLDPATQKTYDRALRVLARRGRSAKELRERLLAKGEDPARVDAVVARLVANRLLDDAALAEAQARTAMLGKGRSQRRLEHDLARRGVARDVAGASIARVLADEGTDEAAVAERAARKKLASLARYAPMEQRQKLYGYLARQGFSPDVVRKALRAVLEAPATGDVGDDE